MWGLLGVIGLITILWLISKGLNKVGNALIKFGENMADRASAVEAIKQRDRKNIKDNLTEIKKKLGELGRDSDREYKERVQREIDELTKD